MKLKVQKTIVLPQQFLQRRIQHYVKLEWSTKKRKRRRKTGYPTNV